MAVQFGPDFGSGTDYAIHDLWRISGGRLAVIHRSPFIGGGPPTWFAWRIQIFSPDLVPLGESAYLSPSGSASSSFPFGARGLVLRHLPGGDVAMGVYSPNFDPLFPPPNDHIDFAGTRRWACVGVDLSGDIPSITWETPDSGRAAAWSSAGCPWYTADGHQEASDGFWTPGASLMSIQSAPTRVVPVSATEALLFHRGFVTPIDVDTFLPTGPAEETGPTGLPTGYSAAWCQDATYHAPGQASLLLALGGTNLSRYGIFGSGAPGLVGTFFGSTWDGNIGPSLPDADPEIGPLRSSGPPGAEGFATYFGHSYRSPFSSVEANAMIWPHADASQPTTSLSRAGSRYSFLPVPLSASGLKVAQLADAPSGDPNFGRVRKVTTVQGVFHPASEPSRGVSILEPGGSGSDAAVAESPRTLVYVVRRPSGAWRLARVTLPADEEPLRRGQNDGIRSGQKRSVSSIRVGSGRVP